MKHIAWCPERPGSRAARLLTHWALRAAYERGLRDAEQACEDYSDAISRGLSELSPEEAAKQEAAEACADAIRGLIPRG